MDLPSLVFALHQPDDGDGLARYRLAAANQSFSCRTAFWGYAEQFEELASAIAGFPASPSSKVEFSLGTPNLGQCKLEFSCIDGSGHAVVWVSAESEYPVYPSSSHQHAKLCLRVEPAAVDRFRDQLLGLASGTVTSAALDVNEP